MLAQKPEKKKIVGGVLEWGLFIIARPASVSGMIRANQDDYTKKAYPKSVLKLKPPRIACTGS